MPLPVTVAIFVLAMLILVGGLGYLIDHSESAEAEERTEQEERR